MARRCLEKGARQVIIWDINEKAIAETVAELSRLGKVCGFRADISDAGSVQDAYEATRAACGDVDILINNAGIVANNRNSPSRPTPTSTTPSTSTPRARCTSPCATSRT